MWKHSLSYLVPQDKNISSLIKKKKKLTHFCQKQKQWEGPDFEFTEHSSTFLGSETE